MNAWTACSCLAPQIERFIELRRLSGSSYDSQARLFGYFDRFLVEQNVKEPRVTREICERYLESLVKLAPRTRGNRFCVVRQLCEYLARTDPRAYLPEPLRGPLSRQAHAPYIFTPQEVAALLSAAMRLPPLGALRPHTYRTLFGLLYSTGIRIGEAFALNLDSFFPADQRLSWMPLRPSEVAAGVLETLGSQESGASSPLLPGKSRLWSIKANRSEQSR